MKVLRKEGPKYEIVNVPPRSLLGRKFECDCGCVFKLERKDLSRVKKETYYPYDGEAITNFYIRCPMGCSFFGIGRKVLLGEATKTVRVS